MAWDIKEEFSRVHGLDRANFAEMKTLVDKEGVSCTEKLRIACVAALNNCWDMVKRIINQYIPVVSELSTEENEYVPYAEFILFVAIENRLLGMLKYFAEKRPDIFFCGGNVANYAIVLGQLDTLKYLVEERNITISGPLPCFKGTSLLFEAIRYKQDCIIDYLIDKGADLTFVGSHGMTILHEAAQADNPKVIKLVLEKKIKGLDINIKTWEHRDGYTPLHVCSIVAKKETCKWLIENGADVNMQDSEGLTPLHRCLESNDKWLDDARRETCKLLIENGADLNVKDKNGESPLDYLVKFEEMCKYLIEHGVSPQSKFNNSLTENFSREHIVNGEGLIEYLKNHKILRNRRSVGQHENSFKFITAPVDSFRQGALQSVTKYIPQAEGTTSAINLSYGIPSEQFHNFLVLTRLLCRSVAVSSHHHSKSIKRKRPNFVYNKTLWGGEMYSIAEGVVSAITDFNEI